MRSNLLRISSRPSLRNPRSCPTRVLWLAAAFAFGVALCAGETSRAQTTLAWKFREGDKFRYKIHYKATATVETGAGGKTPKDVAPSLDVVLTWSVAKVATDGTADITQRVERIREAMRERSDEGPELIYDSADPKTINNAWSDLRSRIYRPVLGEPYRLKIDRHGEVVDLQLPKNTLQGWKGFNLLPREDRDLLFTKAGVQTLLSIMPKLPGKPIARGDSWQSQRNVTVGPLRQTLVETYSPTGQAGQLVAFKANPKVSVQIISPPVPEEIKPSASAKAISLVGATIEEQSGRSQLVFDQDAGSLVTFSRKMNYVISGKFDRKPGSDRPRLVSSRTIIESEINLITGPPRH